MTAKVHMNSTVLAALLYECATATTDTEGFLLGTKATQTRPRIDDSSDEATHITEALVVVHAYHRLLPDWPRFYDQGGNVNVDPLHHHLQHIPADSAIVGYFKSRRQSALALSVRDQLLMRSLRDLFDQFSCMAIISAGLSLENDLSTHAYDYAFWHSSDPESKMALHIANMADSTLAYQHFTPTVPVAPSGPKLRHIQSTVEKAITSQTDGSLVHRYDSVYEASMDSLLAATNDIVQKEKELAKLKSEVRRLERGIHAV